MTRAGWAPGPIALFGSGETSAVGGSVFDALVRRRDEPPCIAVLETPAGFQPNSEYVATRIADFLRRRLRNFRPTVDVVAARGRQSPWSTDDPAIVDPLLRSTLLFLGPGSPTYAVRQLRDSLAWHTLAARHRLGAAVVLASAACIAAGALALPVYEIYKAGTDLHWSPGLDLLGPYGLSVVFVPHWNNTEGGAELDTSRCFMGVRRFARLYDLLPQGSVVVGIDEHTALVMDLAENSAQVCGKGSVTVLQAQEQQTFPSGATFPLDLLGPFRLSAPVDGIPATVWSAARAAQEAQSQGTPVPSADVVGLVTLRNEARERHDWATADRLRQDLVARGWNIKDTRDGPQLEPIETEDG